MKALALNLHLQKRNGAWYYRGRVPDRLIATGHPKYLQQSLGTTSLKRARQLRTIRDLEFDARFAAAEAELSRAPAKLDPIAQTSPRVLTGPLAARLLQDYVERIDDRRRLRSAANPPKDADERREAEENIAAGLAIALNRAPAYDHAEAISIAWDEIVRSANIKIDEEVFPQSAFVAGGQARLCRDRATGARARQRRPRVQVPRRAVRSTATEAGDGIGIV
jgi:hypothetical protein